MYRYQHCCHTPTKAASLPARRSETDGTITCSVAAIQHSCELKRTGEAEADIVVPILRSREFGIVAISGAAILCVVVPTAAAIHAVVALSMIGHSGKSMLSLKFRVLAWPINANRGRARRWQTVSLHSPES